MKKTTTDQYLVGRGVSMDIITNKKTLEVDTVIIDYGKNAVRLFPFEARELARLINELVGGE